MQRVNTLRRGDGLFLAKDVQNPVDPLALSVRTEDPPAVIGYCPRFLTSDVGRLLEQPETVKLTVSQVNADAPLQYRLLCRLQAPWLADFTTFADKEFNAGLA